MKRILIGLVVIFASVIAVLGQGVNLFADLSKIEAYIEEGKWEDAETAIIGIMKEDPSHPRNNMLFFNLGVCQYNQEKYEDALNSFTIVLNKNQNYFPALYRRALTSVALGDVSRAVEDLEKALTISPKDKDALYLDALLNYNIYLAANLEKSKLPLCEADETSPNLERAERNISIILEEENSLEPDAATHLLAARIFAAAKNHSEATQHYLKALEIEKNKDTYLEAISYLILDNEDTETAQSLINEALKTYPTVGEIYMLQALINLKNGHEKEAEENKKIAKKYGVDTQTIDFFLMQK